MLNHLKPTALLLEVDETILSLPWELLFDADDRLYAINVPTGRVVTTRTAPTDRRDSLTDDAEITILVLAPAAADLASVDGEVDAIAALAGDHGGVRLNVDVLRGDQATRGRPRRRGEGADAVEIVHVAAHGRFDKKAGALRLGDGWFDAAQVAALEWDGTALSRVRQRVRVGARRARQAPALTGTRRAGWRPRSSRVEPRRTSGTSGPSATSTPRSSRRRSTRRCSVRATSVRPCTRRAARSAARSRNAVDLTAVGAVFFGDSGTAERADLAMAESEETP